MQHDHDEELSLGSVFSEPPRPPTPDPTFYTCTREGDQPDITIRLIGSHPLWGHHLWNAAIATTSYLDAHKDLVVDRYVLELGAGGGLPGIVAFWNGASKVVLTDYPDPSLIKNLEYNVGRNVTGREGGETGKGRVTTQGYIWGRSVDDLVASLPQDRDPWRGFDLIILSDLLFNHSQHDALLRSCELCLTPTPGSDQASDARRSVGPPPCVLVFYTHHRPRLAHRDLEFFTQARERGWICEEVYTNRFPPMFPEEVGDEEMRSTVHGWRMTRV